MSRNFSPAGAPTRLDGLCLGQLVDRGRERDPGATAVASGPEELSHAELHLRANRLASHLLALGVRPETRVGVLLSRGPELPAALLGVLKAGATCVPLDPRAPRTHRALICQDAGLRLAVTEPALRADLPPEVRAIDLAAEAEALSRQPPEAPEARVRPDNLAYLIYTSGSTGRPKGVMVTHRGMVNHALAVVERYSLRPGDRVLQLAAIGFDVASEEIFPTLGAGATLVLGPAELPTSFGDFCAFIAEREVSVLNLPAAFWHAWVAELDQGLCAVPECVRQLVVGSEAVLRRPWERWRARVGPRVRLLNAYGPTEATVTATLFEPVAGEPLPAGTSPAVPIGRPIANVRASVLDARGRPVPEGGVGILHLGGPGVARGYLGRPDLTAERFRPDPSAAEPGARLYDTGDRVRLLPSGDLEFLGRDDRQVKVRGHRIELAEVEQALASHPAVRQAAVVLHEPPSGPARLVAWWVPGGEERDADALRRFLSERLPPAAVPSTLVEVEALPLTANGKVDTAALVVPPDLPGYVPPRTGTERALALIFEEVLGAGPVGARDSFFELGGHSLAAMRVAGRIRSRLGVDLPLRALLEARTVEALARAVDSLPRATSSAPTFERLPRPERLPLSFPQEQVWLLQHLDPTSVAYTAPTLIHLEGALDVDALQRSVDELVRRHEVLRTTFPAVEGKPVQRIHPPAGTPLACTDLSQMPEREAALERGVAEELRAPFAMDRLPLIRWRLFRMAADRHALVVVEHHLVHDGWSTNVLFQELFALYAAFARGEPSPLPEPALQFADFVVWHRHWLERGEAARQLRYWTERLSGAPERLSLPADHPRPPVQRFCGAALRVHLPEEIDRALRERCREEGVTPYVVLLAAYASLLSRYSRQADLCIGSGIANRRWRETEGMLGMLINTIVLRADLADDPPFRTLLRRLQERTLEAAAHQDLPFERIVEALHLERDPSRNPLFQVMFGLHDAPLSPAELPGLRWRLLESPPNGSSKFDLGLIVIPRPETAEGWNPSLGSGGFTLVWEFNTDLFEPATIRQMQARYQRLLEAALASPELPVSRLPLIAPGERARALAAWNPTGAPYPADRCIHALFSEQAKARPEAPAVTYGDRSLTWRELDERSNRLAQHLRARGIRDGAVVGLCLERSPQAVVGMLGILKAGAAYLPLDPSHPPERLAFMVADAGAAMVVAGRAADAEPFAEGRPVLGLEEAESALSRERATPPESTTPAGGLAHILYTSGSTGRPKGVMVTHRGVVRLVRSGGFLQVDPSDRFAQLSTLAFDAATLEIWGALLNGAELVGLARELTLAPEELARFIRDRRLSVLFLTTALFNRLVAERPDLFAPLRTVMFGGEAADPRRVREVLRHGPPGRVLNLYGPTEVACVSSWHLVQQVADDATGVPIGRPIANTTLYVLDAHLEPVPPGIPGELYAGGDGVALGYVGRPDLTAERFVPDPFGGRPGARLYATGDVVRQREDGALEFLGRVDEQVKLRGFRVEPGEVQALLERHPAVASCAVLPREGAGGEKSLAAYVAAKPGAPAPSSRELRAWLQARVPPYLVPASLRVLDVLPLTSNGKVDRRALSALPPEELPPAGADAPARTATEEQLARLWAEVLPPGAIGGQDSFFHLGGHSLGAMQVLAKVRAEMGVDLPVRCFFETPTLSAVAAAIDERRKEQEDERLARLLSEVERLPAEEVERLLATGGRG